MTINTEGAIGDMPVVAVTLTEVVTPDAQSKPLGLIASQIAELIRPITRFDASDLCDIVAETHSGFLAKYGTTQDVLLSIEVSDKPGPLGKSAHPCYTRGSVDLHLFNMLSKATAELQKTMENWATSDDKQYRRLLPHALLLGAYSGSVGYEYGCGTCLEKGKVTCTTCTGKGQNNCTTCAGSGVVYCGVCNGTRRVSCVACYGAGGRNAIYTNSNNTTSSRWEHCGFCSGGSNQCHGCNAYGKVTCDKCGGCGLKDCLTCQTSGKLNCSHCLATGRMNRLGFLKARVDFEHEIDFIHADPKVAALAWRNIDIENLPSYGQVHQIEHFAGKSGVGSLYVINLGLTSALIAAGGLEFKIHAFGRQREIFDFCNIAGSLLSADLAQLEYSVASASAWRSGRQDTLFSDTGLFVKSELNLLLVEGAQNPEKDALPLPAVAAAKSINAIDDNYAKRATDAFNGALKKMYVAQLALPGLCCIGLAAFVSVGIHRLNWLGAWATWCLSAAIIVILWWGLELIVQVRIDKRFPSNVGGRIVEQISKSGLGMRVRVQLWVLAGAASAAVIALLKQ